MKKEIFIENFRKAFGEFVELPLVFWYSDVAAGVSEKINGCFFKGIRRVRDGGEPLSLSMETIGCGGGKFYTGFTPMPEHVPGFVSQKERYKETPVSVLAFIDALGVPRAEKPFLNFARIDRKEDFTGVEGILFFAVPDVLSGLVSWAFFDNNAPDAVSSLFGSGCSAMVTQAVLENRADGRRTFLGLFDPSVRPYIEAGVLGFAIPMSRFREMYETMPHCCLFDTHAWGKVRERIVSGPCL